jgi:hypothetical protein
MGRRRRDGNHPPQKTNLIVDSEGNKENRHLVLDCNKTNKHKLHQGTQ